MVRFCITGRFATGCFLLCVMTTSACDPAVTGENNSFNVNPPSGPEWVACDASAQCGRAWLSCYGWVAVNRQFEDDFLQWYYRENNEYLSLVECDGPVVEMPVTICQDRECLIPD